MALRAQTFPGEATGVLLLISGATELKGWRLEYFFIYRGISSQVMD